jgi:hypothetical protein
MFKLLSTAYSSIYVDDAARVLGVGPAEATSCKYLPFSTYMVADFSAKTQTLGPPPNRQCCDSVDSVACGESWHTPVWSKIPSEFRSIRVAVASQREWAFDPATNILTTKKLPGHSEQKTDVSHLQNLTDYVFQLEQ